MGASDVPAGPWDDGLRCRREGCAALGTHEVCVEAGPVWLGLTARDERGLCERHAVEAARAHPSGPRAHATPDVLTLDEVRAMLRAAYLAGEAAGTRAGALAEREACAAVCDERHEHAKRRALDYQDVGSHARARPYHDIADTAGGLARLIRARGAP